MSQCRKFLSLTNTEKSKELREYGRCYKCIDSSHLAKNCNENPKCKKCNESHHTVWHKEKNENGKNPSLGVMQCSVYQSGHTVLQTGRARMNNTMKNVSKEISVLFDTAASFTFAVKRTWMTYRKMNLMTFGNNKGFHECPVYELTLTSVKGSSPIICDVYGIEGICDVPSYKIDLTKTEELNDLNLADQYDGRRSPRISVLIGADTYSKFLTGEHRVLNNELTVLGTVFGHVIFGTITEKQKCDDMNCGMAMVISGNERNENEILNNQLKSIFDLEMIGINKDEEKNEDIKLDDIQYTYENNTYTVKLRLKENIENLGKNEHVAQKRFDNLMNRLTKEKQEQFTDELQKFDENGYSEKCDKKPDGKYEYYLPLQCVFKKSSTTTPVRPVFDASCKTTSGLSLNDCLHIGQNLLPDLMMLLIKFRQNKYAFCADISKAFFTIEVAKEHRDLLRFVIRDPDDKIVYNRLTKVPFGLNCSPNILQTVTKIHVLKFEDKFPELVADLLQKIFMDDYLSGKDELNEAIFFAKTAKEIFAKANMKLTKFRSNSAELLSAIDEQQNEGEVSFSKMNEMNDTKVLGLNWLTKNDTITYDASQILENMTHSEKITKRSILKLAAKLFDPTGFITPVTITARILLQKIWSLGLDWDDKVPSDIKNEWMKWLYDLENLEEIEIPRFLFDGMEDYDTLELHAFSDASMKAYGCCIYLKMIKGSKSQMRLITAKGRVAPLKTVTLPHLELLGALLSARLMKYVKPNIEKQIDRSYYWTDSKVALAWIKGDPHRWKQFVSNRVIEIQDISDPGNWYHIKGDENPADIASRGTPVSKLLRNKLWWDGPTNMEKSDDHEMNINDEKTRAEIRKIHEGNVNNVVKDKCLIDIDEYTSWPKLVKVIATLQKCAKIWMNKTQKTATNESAVELTIEDMEKARKFILKSEQKKIYGNLDELMNDKSLLASSRLNRLRPFMDENGLMRSKTRISEASHIEIEKKSPIILPPNSNLTRLLVIDEHIRLMHSGVNSTLNSIQNGYWIPRGRSTVRHILHSCIPCKRDRAKPIKYVEAQIPTYKLILTRAFDNSSVDYTGPIYIKTENGQMIKHYIALFACNNTKAVHLELVPSLEASDFLDAMKRFVARRGYPKHMNSDNGTNFRSKMMNEYALENEITWHYILPSNPRAGGLWERLVGLMKKMLKKQLKRQKLNYVQMLTVLCEIEAALNKRP